MDLAGTLSIECDTERWEHVDQQDQGFGSVPFRDNQVLRFVQVPPSSFSGIQATVSPSSEASSSSSSLLIFNLGLSIYSLLVPSESHAQHDSVVEPQASGDGAQSCASPTDQSSNATDKPSEDEDVSVSSKEVSTESPNPESNTASEAQTRRAPVKHRKNKLITFPSFVSGLDFNASAAPGVPDLAITLLQGDIVLVRLSEIMEFSSTKGSVSMAGGNGTGYHLLFNKCQNFGEYYHKLSICLCFLPRFCVALTSLQIQRAFQ